MTLKRYLRMAVKWVLPKRIHASLLDLKESFQVKCLMASPRYLDFFVRREIECFAPNRQWANRDGPHSFRVAAYWDSDGRFRWLQQPAIERNIGLLHVPRSIYRSVFAQLFQKNGYRPDERKGEVSLSVFYENRFKSSREKYLWYCRAVSASIARQFSIDVFLLFKLNDEWIVDVIRGIRQNAIPVVVHDREHGIIKKRMEIYPDYLKQILDDLLVDRLCLTNETHYKFFELCGFPTTSLSLTGKPDIDAWFHGEAVSRQSISSSLRDDVILLVFFAFGRFNYLNFFYQDETRDWEELADDFHEVILDLLEKYGNRIQIVYKVGGKPQRDNYPGFDDFLTAVKELGRADSLLVLDGNISTIDLLRVSDCVVAFHTLGVAEAMFTDQPVFYGAWGSLFNDIKDTLIPFHLWRGLSFCPSKSDLREAIFAFLDNHHAYQIADDVKCFREQDRKSMYYRPDGHSSERLIRVLEDVVVRSKALT
jgi:hypothetical protein